nr:response regulator [Clostridium caldaquaticum]
MIKLLVVDDETTTRKGLIKHISWNDLGVQLVEEAKDGFDALEVAARIQPNIILSDIRMPGLNGIELAERVKEQLPDCRIIFLSGYSDKEYLKAAINLSAVSYVEKPIDISEVKEAVKKAVNLCIEDERRKLSEKNASIVLTENLSFVKQKIITNLIGAEADIEERVKELKLMNIDFNLNDRFNSVIISFHEDKVHILQNSQFNSNKLIHIIDESFSYTEHVAAFTGSNKIVVILLSELAESKSKLIRAFELIKKQLKKYDTDDFELFCTVGQCVRGMDKISESYRTAELTLKKLFFYGYDNIVFYENSMEEPFFLDESIHNKFAQYLSEQKQPEAVSLIESLTRDIKKYNNTPVNYVKNIFFKLTFQLFMEAEKRGVYFSEAGEKEENYLWDLISGFNTLQEIRSYLIDKINSVFKRIEELESSGRTVFQVKKYIQKNYSNENLSTKILADLVYLTPAYLSGLFKKETGKTISEYIIEFRIEKSKEYLKDTKLKLFEVAKSVGYSDANYYAKAFKKLTGLTPSEYREKYLS